eukprot:RCo004696
MPAVEVSPSAPPTAAPGLSVQISNVISGFHRTYMNLEAELKKFCASKSPASKVTVYCDTTPYGTYVGTATLVFENSVDSARAAKDLHGAVFMDKTLEAVRV